MTRTAARQRLWVRRGVPVVVVVLLIGGFVATRAVASSDGSPSYRLGRVTVGDVEQTLTLNGTARKASQATSSFAVSGTVASVPVGVGERVNAGQTLATLDPTALQRAVTSATATLAQAEATLDADQNGTSSSTSSTASSTTSTTATTTATTTAARRTVTTTPAAVVRAQAAVRAAQAKVAADLHQLAQDQTAQAPACAPYLTAGTTPPAGATPTLADCLAALQATTAAESGVGQDQRALAAAQAALSTALARQAATPSASGSTASSASRSGTGSASGGSSGAAAGTGSSATFSAQRVASDKAAVQSAKSALATARADRDDATLTAPISGTVAALSLVAGQSSGSGSVTIVGPGAVDVTVDVPLASLPKVKVGQAATVTANGSLTAMAGTVHSISLLPASSTTTSVSYPVVVRVPRPVAALASGAGASVTISLLAVHHVVTVPNTALTTLVAGTGVVQTVKAGRVTRTLVRTGAVGATRTQILSGLTAGQQVVIADLSEALPTTSTSNRFAARIGTGGVTSSLNGGAGLGGGTFVGAFRGPGG